MTQVTAKNIAQALKWMEENDHFKADGTSGTHLVLSNYHDKIRIPLDLWKATGPLTKPGGKFDTRMYRPNFKGKLAIFRAWIEEKLS